MQDHLLEVVSDDSTHDAPESTEYQMLPELGLVGRLATAASLVRSSDPAVARQFCIRAGSALCHMLLVVVSNRRLAGSSSNSNCAYSRSVEPGESGGKAGMGGGRWR